MRDNLTLDVQMTSLRWMFIHVSQFTRCPLYVSPFLSSISCSGARVKCARRKGRRHASVGGTPPNPIAISQANAAAHSIAGETRARAPQREALTIGWPCAALSKVSGSIVPSVLSLTHAGLGKRHGVCVSRRRVRARGELEEAASRRISFLFELQDLKT